MNIARGDENKYTSVKFIWAQVRIALSMESGQWNWIQGLGICVFAGGGLLGMSL